MEAIRQPAYTILYNGKNITADISQSAIQIQYTDKTEGESDEISITLEDTDGKWRGPWYPSKGDTISLQFGYLNSPLINAGTFEIDEFEIGGPPDTITIHGIAAGMTKRSLRTKKSQAFEKTTLRQIAQKIASENGLTVSGEIDTVQFSRITQNREQPLAFLKRISMEYGHLFSVRDGALIFTRIYDIEKNKPVHSLDIADLTSYTIRDKTAGTFKRTSVKYHNHQENETIDIETEENKNADGETIQDTTMDDTLEIRTKAENKQQAELKAKAAMYRTNSLQQEGSVSAEGNPLMVAGNNIELTGIGILSGKYHIMESTHTIDTGAGYSTSLNLKRVGYVEKVKQKSTRPKKDNSTYRVIS